MGIEHGVDLDAIDLPSTHQIVFAGEHGVAIGTYFCTEREHLSAMLKRYATAVQNPDTIAAFWYVNGLTKIYTFCRA
jgi:hypothetical protein